MTMGGDAVVRGCCSLGAPPAWCPFWCPPRGPPALMAASDHGNTVSGTCMSSSKVRVGVLPVLVVVRDSRSVVPAVVPGAARPNLTEPRRTRGL